MAEDRSAHRYHSTLLKCAACDGLGAITWDTKSHATERAFVGLAGDFRLDAARIAGGKQMIVCIECDAIYGPLPANSSQ